MDIAQQIDADIKSAMLAGEKDKLETLRGIKTAMQYEAVALGVKDQGLSKGQAEKVLSREAKKRTDAVELYEKAGEAGRAAKEKTEKELIDTYLPAPASPEDVTKAVDAELAKIDNPTMADMGKVLGAVRARFGDTTDGGLVAKLVKEKLGQ